MSKCEYFYSGWTKERNYGIYSDRHKWDGLKNKRIVYLSGNRLTKEKHWANLLGFLIAA